MLHKVMLSLKSLYRLQMLSLEPQTVGELARESKIPYTSLKRNLSRAMNSELVDCELRPYKRTGKYVYWLTDKGIDWVKDYRELI